MTEGSRLLRKFLDVRGMEQKALAKKVRRSEPIVSQWLSGEHLPSVESAMAIEDATHGAVPARAWTQRPRGSRAA